MSGAATDAAGSNGDQAGRRADARIRTIVDGLDLPECPRWREGRLYWVNGPVIGRTVPGKPAEAFATLPTPMVLGLSFEADGTLLAVAAKDRTIWKVSPHGNAEIFADLSGLCQAPLNEILPLPDGGWVVGGMGFDPASGGEPCPTRLIVLRPDGSASIGGPDVIFPNGLGWIQPGELLVAESFAQRLSIIFYLGNGRFGERRTLLDVSSVGGHPDGVWALGDGTAWYADAWRGSVSLIDSAGTEIERIALPFAHALACCPDEDGGRLFVAVTHAMPGPDREFAGQGALIAIDVKTAA